MTKKKAKKPINADDLDKMMASALQDKQYADEMDEFADSMYRQILMGLECRFDRWPYPVDIWVAADMIADKLFTLVLRGEDEEVEEKKKELM